MSRPGGHTSRRGSRLRPRGVARAALRERGGDGDGALEAVERILREGNGADRMRAAHAKGGMRAVLELLVEETAQAT
jgi:carboxylate-amine ligase